LSDDYPELENPLLVAVTERRTRAELDTYVELMEEVIANA
jgi:glycine cleavage system protein P-like pyridoxal-binding family